MNEKRNIHHPRGGNNVVYPEREVLGISEKEKFEFLKELLESIEKRNESQYNEILMLAKHINKNSLMTSKLINKKLEMTQKLEGTTWHTLNQYL